MTENDVAVAKKKETMFSEDERRSVIEDILIELNVKGDKVYIPYTRAFQASFDLCSLFLQHSREYFISETPDHTAISISEAFGSGEIKAGDWKHDWNYGIRKTYGGCAEGLYKITLSSVGVPTLAGEKVSEGTNKFRDESEETREDHDWVQPLRDVDYERFDRFLAYARRQLMDVRKLEISHFAGPSNETLYFIMTQEGDVIISMEKVVSAEEIQQRVETLCALDFDDNPDLIRRLPVYELKISEEALRRVDYVRIRSDVEPIGQIIDTYNAKLAAVKRKLWEARDVETQRFRDENNMDKED